MRCEQASAFTLIGLLVVIAIIVILAAMHLPELAASKIPPRSFTARPTTHYRQCGIADNLYAYDNKKGLFPCRDNAAQNDTGDVGPSLTISFFI